MKGCQVSLSKSVYYLHKNTPLIYTIRLRKLTGIRQEKFSFTYLGCPIYYGRKRNAFFEDIIKKISRKIEFWQNKFLIFGGKMILIKYVLSSMPIYLLLALCPPKGVMKRLHQIFARFFWGNSSMERRKHWIF